MNITPLQNPAIASDIAPEQLVGNKSLTQPQKIAEASRQFEAVMLRQILGEAQKTVVSSEFSDNSSTAGIYQDLVTTTLANSISKSGAFGLAKIFERQLNRPAAIPKDGPEKTTPVMNTLGHGTSKARPEAHPANEIQPSRTGAAAPSSFR